MLAGDVHTVYTPKSLHLQTLVKGMSHEDEVVRNHHRVVFWNIL